jgi:hypothetical protein
VVGFCAARLLEVPPRLFLIFAEVERLGKQNPGWVY